LPFSSWIERFNLYFVELLLCKRFNSQLGYRHINISLCNNITKIYL